MTCTLTYSSVGQSIAESLFAEENGNLASSCYSLYLQSVRDIFILLFDEFNTNCDRNTWPLDEVMLKQHLKFLSLAQRCTERAMDQLRQPSQSSAVTKIGSASCPTPIPQSKIPQSLSCTFVKPPNPAYPDNSNSLDRRGSQPLLTLDPSSINRHDQSTRTAATLPSNLSQRPSTALESPLEEAQKRNRKLSEAFQKRIQSGKFNAGQLSQMRLTLQRNIAENLSIAHSKEPIFVRKIEEQLWAQQCKIEEQRLAHNHFLSNQKYFNLYKSSTHFEFHFLTKDSWYQRCKNSKRGNASELCFAYLLRLPQHPLRECLKTIIDSTCMSLLAINSNTMSQPSDDYIEDPVYKIGRQLMEDLEAIACVFSIIFTDNIRDCHMYLDWISKAVFPGRLTSAFIYALNTTLASQCCYLRERMDLSHEEQVEISGIKTKYLFLEDPAAYEVSVQELSGLLTAVSPTEKLTVVNNAVTSVVHYVRDKMPENDKGVGADELLPVLCYVILRSREPQLFVHCKMLEALVMDDQMDGAEGYTLTTLITAATYCSTRPIS